MKIFYVRYWTLPYSLLNKKLELRIARLNMHSEEHRLGGMYYESTRWDREGDKIDLAVQVGRVCYSTELFWHTAIEMSRIKQCIRDL